MKLIYNIINHKQTGGGFVELKLRLTNEDWILINQFENKPLFATHTVQKQLLTEKSDTIIEGPLDMCGHVVLRFNFGLEFEEIEQDTGDSFWESVPFKLGVKIAREPFQEEINYIGSQLEDQMKYMVGASQGEDDSCWGKELSIDYK